MLETPFTRLTGAAVPIQIAAMPGVATRELIASTSNAGALGMLGAAPFSPAGLERVLDALEPLVRGVFGVNFLMPFLDPECIPIAARRARVVEFFYGAPDAAHVAAVHACGALACWQVGSLAEARAAEAAGCDLVVVQGTEAGGHVRGSSSLLPLLSQVLDEVRIPVIAAGGLATGRAIASVLAGGAAAARMGTRFVATHESGAHPAYVRALLKASAGDTCLTEAFSVAWPDAPHRVLASALDAARSLADGAIAETSLGERKIAVPRFSVLAPTRETIGHVEAMALYAGESVANIASIRSAGELVAELARDAEALLARATASPSRAALSPSG
jgi:nitronate monooxygenase